MARRHWVHPTVVVLALAVPSFAQAGNIKATLGVTRDGDGCVTFKEVVGAGPVKKGEFLDLRIENRCGKAWKIRVDRFPKRSFSRGCESYDTLEFEFEDSQSFAATNDHRGVHCLATANHTRGTYNFTVSESRPGSKHHKPVGPPIAEAIEPRTHNLAVEVDP